MKNAVHVVVMGNLYRMTKAGYRKYIAALAARGTADVSDFGAADLGRVYDITNITQADAITIHEGGRCSWLPTGRDA